MAIAGRRRVPAGFTNVTYRTVGRLVNRLAAGTDCVPPGTAMSAVPAYEDDDGRWYALRTAVPPRLPHSPAFLTRVSYDRLTFGCPGRSRRFY